MGKTTYRIENRKKGIIFLLLSSFLLNFADK